MASEIYSFENGELLLWVDETGAVHLKVNNPHKDPVELCEDSVRRLRDLLGKLLEDNGAGGEGVGSNPADGKGQV